MTANVRQSGATKTVEDFFRRVEALTDEPLHTRLLGAARRKEPQAALENELKKAIQEILDEA